MVQPLHLSVILPVATVDGVRTPVMRRWLLKAD